MPISKPTRAVAAVALLALAAGCSSSGGDRPRWPADATIYKCDADKELVVQYLEDGKSAMVMYPERDFRLDQVVAASGVRYSNGRTTLHTKGPEAFLEEGGQTLFANCNRTDNTTR
ncbi:MAG TPA: MliC family protein [Burkholderiales bacterium]|nr:MliC family protein [Burkholderiales bacterium]